MAGDGKIRMGMVGGGDYSLIGNTHRLAVRLSGLMQLHSGVFSSRSELSCRFAAELGLLPDRSYARWEEMLEKELTLSSEDRIDAVIIITPNHLHYPIGKAFLEAGFHVVMDKPMVHTQTQAEELIQLVDEKKKVFAVTYNYTGFPMVKKAKELIADGVIGKVRKVVVEYSQGWLTHLLEKGGVKKAEWRMDPDRSGLAGTIADIGTHAENLVTTVTGLTIKEICADLTTFVPGRRLDDDGNLLLHFKGGAKGVLIASQISCGEGNHLYLKVYGEKGGIVWNVENPNVLELKKEKGIQKFSHIPGDEYQDHDLPAANLSAANLEAFTCIYREVGRHIGDILSGRENKSGYDYPTVREGAQGVRFIEKAVTSSKQRCWVSF